jgi:hypothetical protein
MNKIKSYYQNFGLLNTLALCTCKGLDRITNCRWRFKQRFLQTFIDKLMSHIDYLNYKFENCTTFTDKIPVFSLWLQGEENMPEVVRVCTASQKKYFSSPEYEYILLSENTLSDYITVPDVINEKFEGGQITKTNFSDYIRAELLRKYGGIWIDSTMFMTGALDEYEEFINEFFTIKKDKSFSVSNGRWSSYFICCKKNSDIMKCVSAAFIEYWKKYDYLIEYTFLIDYPIDYVYRTDMLVKDLVDSVPYNNEDIVKLHYMKNEAFNEENFNKLLEKNKLHKLTYKEPAYKVNSEGQITYWRKICDSVSQ